MRISKGWAAWIVGIMIAGWSMTALAEGFLFSGIEILDRSAIEKLNDQKLIDTYIDTMIDLEAAQAFYNKAGLTPKEYGTYKNMLRFRTNLILELEKRKLEVPRIK